MKIQRTVTVRIELISKYKKIYINIGRKNTKEKIKFYITNADFTIYIAKKINSNMSKCYQEYIIKISIKEND